MQIMVRRYLAIISHEPRVRTDPLGHEEDAFAIIFDGAPGIAHHIKMRMHRVFPPSHASIKLVFCHKSAPCRRIFMNSIDFFLQTSQTFVNPPKPPNKSGEQNI